MESWIPPAEGGFPAVVEHLGPDLEQEVRSFPRPLHLLFLDHALAHHLVDRGFHEPRADPFAVALTLAIVDDGSGVVGTGRGTLHSRVVIARRSAAWWVTHLGDLEGPDVWVLQRAGVGHRALESSGQAHPCISLNVVTTTHTCSLP